jgi:non-specific serine/threonine protein kinase
VLVAGDYADLGRTEDALQQLNMALTLRANEPSILYNAACTYCGLNRKAEALDALRKAWETGFRDSEWARRDPDLAVLHGDPEFDKLYPEAQTSPAAVTPR